MAKEALVVPREILFKEKHFEGFLPLKEHNFIESILNNFAYFPRGEELENNRELKQIIPYVLIINPKTRKIFVYRRAGDGKYMEKRLWNKWSFGVGGHIEREDNENPIHEAMMRELKEEVTMNSYPEPRIIGFVNFEEGVELYHFGIVAIAETDEDKIEMGDGEIAEGRFMSVDEFEELFGNPENTFDKWTKLIWPFVKEHVLSLHNVTSSI